ncbi:folate family ECF transporter S component [Companilactobacillus baiquanensis]|uniref:Folate family ECF transporter S component n=1 Tax=Companilactobacillus baiquanensis TaxID=2486005 RepID=A0ABW1UT79_9LACO|nr:folate family ECF transporter S component [Companilactobacillus baiquanensis]
MLSKSRSSISVHELTWMAILIALEMVLSRFSIGSNALQVGFSFVAMGLIGYYFGPYKAAIAMAIADIMKMVILPSSGGFFWGFTVSAIVGGIIYGFMLYNKKVTITRVLITTVLVVVIVNTLMNTWWIHMISNAPYWVLLTPRLIKEAISLVYQTGILYLVLKWISNSKFNKIN